MIYLTAMRFGVPAMKCRFPRAGPHGADSRVVESEVDKLEGGGEVGASTKVSLVSGSALLCQTCVLHGPVDLLLHPRSGFAGCSLFERFATDVAGKFTSPTRA